MGEEEEEELVRDARRLRRGRKKTPINRFEIQLVPYIVRVRVSRAREEGASHARRERDERKAKTGSLRPLLKL